MSENIDAAAVWPPRQVPRRRDRFDATSMAFHWLTVLLVAMQFITMWALVLAEREAEVLTTIHRSTGSVLWIVVVARLIWRHNFAYLPAFPGTMPKFRQRIATLNEYTLYFLLLLQPLTGFFNTLFRGRSFDLLIWQVPALLERNKAVYGLFQKLHELGATALLVLI